MLTEICQYLRNWFDRKPDGGYHPKFYGDFVIENGAITGIELQPGQYFRIMGSLFNDGVHDTTDTLHDEAFSGAVWFLGFPPSFIALATEIQEWQAAYGGVSSESMSPFQSESFGGYSYSKSSGGSSAGGGDAGTWQSAYAARLAPWRKV